LGPPPTHRRPPAAALRSAACRRQWRRLAGAWPPAGDREGAAAGVSAPAAPRVAGRGRQRGWGARRPARATAGRTADSRGGDTPACADRSGGRHRHPPGSRCGASRRRPAAGLLTILPPPPVSRRWVDVEVGSGMKASAPPPLPSTWQRVRRRRRHRRAAAAAAACGTTGGGGGGCGAGRHRARRRPRAHGGAATRAVGAARLTDVAPRGCPGASRWRSAHRAPCCCRHFVGRRRCPIGRRGVASWRRRALWRRLHPPPWRRHPPTATARGRLTTGTRTPQAAAAARLAPGTPCCPPRCACAAVAPG